MLDAFAVAMCIVDANRSVRMMNRAAVWVTNQQESLVLREQRLCGIEQGATARLSTAVENACGLSHEEDAFQIAGRPPASGLQVQVRALPIRSDDGLVTEPLALVMFGQATSDRYDTMTLRRKFGLSNAEACLLNELLSGKRLDECALARGIKVGTARTQLKAIFTKTGASSQAQLVAIAKTLPATSLPLPPSSGTGTKRSMPIKGGTYRVGLRTDGDTSP